MPAKGYKLNESARAAISAARRASKGKYKLSETHKMNIAESLRSAYREGRRLPNYHLRHDANVRKRISEASKRQVWTEERRRNVSEGSIGKSAPWTSERNKSEEMRIVARKTALKRVSVAKLTDIEKKVYDQLSSAGIKFERGFILNDLFCYDFRVGNVLIECDGEYWHGFGENVSRDFRKNKFAEENGFKILRIPGREILKEGFNVLVMI